MGSSPISATLGVCTGPTCTAPGFAAVLTRLSALLPVHILPVCHAQHQDHETVVVAFIHHAIIADPDFAHRLPLQCDPVSPPPAPEPRAPAWRAMEWPA